MSFLPRAIFPASFFKIFALALPSFLSLSWVAAAQGQELFTANNLDQPALREQIERYMAGVQDAEPVPLNIYYQLLLRDLLTDRETLARLPPADLEFLSDVRSPMDQRFVLKAQQELESICSDLHDAGSSVDPEHFALRLAESRKRHDRDLDTYYSSVVSLLSPDTQQLVQSLLIEHSESSRVAHARFDIVGLALDFPESATAVLHAGCDRFGRQATTAVPGASFLDDAISHHALSRQ